MSALNAQDPICRLGVIGDVHAEEALLAQALDVLGAAGVDTVVCTGDIADGPGCVDSCCTMLREAGVLTVAGNHDRWLLTSKVRHIDEAHRVEDLSEENHEFLAGLSQTSHLDTAAGPLLLCHGVSHNDLRKVWPGTQRMKIERSSELDTIIDDGDYRFVVNGHLHYRCVINFEDLTLINAGTIYHRHRPGVSVVDFQDGSVAAFELEATKPGNRVAEKGLAPDDSRRIWRDTQEFDGAWTPTVLY
jgi:predicted phosphodiesterase